MQTSKENPKTPETTESKGTQVAPKRNPADLGTTPDQKNEGNDQTAQKPRPATGEQEDLDVEENEELEDENTPTSEIESDIDQAGSEKNSIDPSRNRPGANSPDKRGL